MANDFIQIIFYLLVLLILAIPLGKYIAKVMEGELNLRVINPIENIIYKLMGVNKCEEMDWKEYAKSVLVYSIIGFVFLFVVQLIQGKLPLNPQGLKGTSIGLTFNTTASFISNTNWQSYAGETTYSYLTQMIGLTVQNFVSAACGIAVLFALIRGFVRTKCKTIGNFWVDMVRSIIYILLPMSVVVSLALVSQGVVQNFKHYEEISIVEPFTTEDGVKIDKQTIPMGPAASQIAIKQLGTNGGGFFGANSAHPLENPTPISNMMEVLSILLIPVALCFSFGHVVKDKRQGRALFIAMFMVLILFMVGITYFEQVGTPQLAQNGDVNLQSTMTQSGGNMEGKEVRFGIAGSTIWTTATTAASNGSVNAMHDSYTPLGGMLAMILMQLGEVIFGGVGSGLYGMIAFVIVAVFVAGLMVGRTPEYLGKKIEPFEMKMAVLIVLVPPILVLTGTAIATVMPGIVNSLNNSGPHAFSEILYAYTSAANNNGSAFAGLNANTTFLNVTLGFAMLLARFVPMFVTVAIAGSLAKKKRVPATAGTLATHNGLFIGLVITVIILIGALSFFPALALGPIVEHLQMLL